VSQIDKIVAGSFAATHHNIIFRQYWRLWIISSLGTMLYTKDTAGPLFSSFDPAYVQAVDESYELVTNFANKVRSENRKKRETQQTIEYKEMDVDEKEVVELATKLKTICDQRLQALHKQLIFDVMPTFPVLATEPVISPGGASSEYQMDFLVGQKRPRPLSFLFALADMASVQVAWLVGKVLGRRYTYGDNLVRLYNFHQVGDKVRRVTPVAMLRRIYLRLTNRNLQ